MYKLRHTTFDFNYLHERNISPEDLYLHRYLRVGSRLALVICKRAKSLPRASLAFRPAWRRAFEVVSTFLQIPGGHGRSPPKWH